MQVPLSGKGCSFDELLKGILSSSHRFKLIRTAQATKYITDGLLISMMQGDEVAAINKQHNQFSARSEKYASIEPLDLRSSIPKILGYVVDSCKNVDLGNGMSCVLLEGKDRQALVPSLQFFTLHKRHPDATWWFAAKNHWKRPIILTKLGGLRDGMLLGSLATIPAKNALTISKEHTIIKKRRLSEKGLFYQVYQEPVYEKSGS